MLQLNLQHLLNQPGKHAQFSHHHRLFMKDVFLVLVLDYFCVLVFVVFLFRELLLAVLL